MKERHHRSVGLVAAMALGIATAFMTTVQAQGGAVLTAQSEGLGGWIEHDSQLSGMGCLEDAQGKLWCYGEDRTLPGSMSTEAERMLAAPQGSGGLNCDHQGNCRTRASVSGDERVTMFAGISMEPPEPQPLCDTDPFSCFYLVDKDRTVPGGMRNTQQAFLE